MKNTVIESPERSRPSYRPPLGLPLRRDSRWGTVLSFLFHALLILLILAPLLQHDVALIATRGGLGPGAAGGGGGGSRGAAGRPREEHVQFVRPVPQLAVAPLQPPVPPKPVPPPPPTPPTVPTLAKVDEKVDAGPPVAVPSTGDAGTLGAGPGTGGGIGTGSGTGRGSAEGPGTGGGGVGDTALAKPYFQTVPMIPHPHSLDGKQLQVLFAVDEHGATTRVEFASTGDRSFDKKLRAVLMEWKFRPAFLRSNNTPVPSVFPGEVSF